MINYGYPKSSVMFPLKGCRNVVLNALKENSTKDEPEKLDYKDLSLAIFTINDLENMDLKDQMSTFKTFIARSSLEEEKLRLIMAFGVAQLVLTNKEITKQVVEEFRCLSSVIKDTEDRNTNENKGNSTENEKKQLCDYTPETYFDYLYKKYVDSLGEKLIKKLDELTTKMKNKNEVNKQDFECYKDKYDSMNWDFFYNKELIKTE